MPPADGSDNAANILKPSVSNLGRIYEETDDQSLSQVSPRKESRRIKSAIVQLKGATIDTRKVDLEANVMLSDDESDDEEAIGYPNYPSNNGLVDGSDDESEEESEMDKDDDEDNEDEDEDDEQISLDEQGSDPEEDDVSDMEPSPPPKLSRKQQRAANHVARDDQKSKISQLSVSTSRKSVSFAPYTKAGAKIRKQASAPQSQSKPKVQSVQKANAAPIKVSKPDNVTSIKKTTSQVEGDDYDFSRYF